MDRVVDLARSIGVALDQKGTCYQVVGGLAVYLHAVAAGKWGAHVIGIIEIEVDCAHLKRMEAAVSTLVCSLSDPETE